LAKRKVLESRRTERVQVSWRVLILLPKDQSADGRIYDVSGGGLLFAAPFKYKRGDRVALDIITSPRQFVRTRIFVMRQAGREDGLWVYGAKFVDLKGLDRIFFEAGLENVDSQIDPIDSTRPPSTVQERAGFGGLLARIRRPAP
jgi:hypothetical protein